MSGVETFQKSFERVKERTLRENYLNILFFDL
jgi:hypothetical protein